MIWPGNLDGVVKACVMASLLSYISYSSSVKHPVPEKSLGNLETIISLSVLIAQIFVTSYSDSIAGKSTRAKCKPLPTWTSCLVLSLL